MEKKIEEMTTDERIKEAQAKIMEILTTYSVQIGVQTMPTVVDMPKQKEA